MDNNKPKGSDGPKAGDTPGVVGSVVVVLTDNGRIGATVTGGLSQLVALGLLAAASSIIINSTAREKNMIVPGTGIPDALLRRRPKQGQ